VHSIIIILYFIINPTFIIVCLSEGLRDD
jgi:hypothetical protein